MSDEMKSAIELAMEKADQEMGDDLPNLSDEQKKEIADIRSRYQAKIAQEEISAQTRIRDAFSKGDQAAAAQVEEGLRSEKRRFERLMEQEIEGIRKGQD